MTVASELISAAIAIATGLVVALTIQGASAIIRKRQRWISTGNIRSVVQEFEIRLRSTKALEDRRFTKEQAQGAFWQEHLEIMRLVASANSPYLRQEGFIEIMKLIDGQARLTRMITARNRVPPSEFYEQYFKELRSLDWLKLEKAQS